MDTRVKLMIFKIFEQDPSQEFASLLRQQNPLHFPSASLSSEPAFFLSYLQWNNPSLDNAGSAIVNLNSDSGS